MIYSINHEGVCRTAPAKPGLFKNKYIYIVYLLRCSDIVKFAKTQHIFYKLYPSIPTKQMWLWASLELWNKYSWKSLRNLSDNQDWSLHFSTEQGQFVTALSDQQKSKGTFQLTSHERRTVEMTEERNHNLQKEIDKGTCDSLIYNGKVQWLNNYPTALCSNTC